MADTADLPLGLPLGTHRNVPSRIYHRRRIGLVSKGALDAIGWSPKHYQSWLVEPDENTPALFFGRAFHCALLEPRVFADEYTCAPDFGDCRFKENKAARDAWRATTAGKIELSSDDMTRIGAMVESIRAHELGAMLLRDGEPEVTMTWRDADTGLFCKTRPDYRVKKHRMCVDVKTTDDARVEHFTRDAVRYDYPLQDALYRAGFAATGEPVDHFLFLAVEKSPPFDVAVHTLDANGVGRGYSRARMRMELMAKCLRDDKWPGYDPHINTLDLPPWY